MKQFVEDWPDDADGDVFRRLVEHDFDFSKKHAVDYNVDFGEWPPNAQAIAALASTFGPVTLHGPNEFGDGYAQFQVHGPVTYDGVTAVQLKATSVTESFGGVCESWGLMQEPPYNQ